MEVQEIRYFLALCDTLNFTRASERCNVSQPALTRAIQNLEGKLGGPLIHRERGNTHLTELGRIMEPYFRQVLGQMEEARQRAQSYVRLDASTLTIGLMCTIGPHRLINLFSEFIAGHAGIEIYLRDASAQVLEELLTKGEIDVAIFCRPDELDERFHVMPLYRERFVVAIGPGHPFERLNAVRVKDLHQQNISRAPIASITITCGPSESRSATSSSSGHMPVNATTGSNAWSLLDWASRTSPNTP